MDCLSDPGEILDASLCGVRYSWGDNNASEASMVHVLMDLLKSAVGNNTCDILPVSPGISFVSCSQIHLLEGQACNICLPDCGKCLLNCAQVGSSFHLGDRSDWEHFLN
jgi:hypothetical protein